MKTIGIVRHIDDLGRITFPKEIRRNMGLKEGDALEIITNYNGKEIVIRPYKKSWEDTVIEWWTKNQNRPALRRASFCRMGDYTFCTVDKSYDGMVAGFAKRYCKDKDDDRIGRVAAFARAIGKPINELVGWKD